MHPAYRRRYENIRRDIGGRTAWTQAGIEKLYFHIEQEIMNGFALNGSLEFTSAPNFWVLVDAYRWGHASRGSLSHSLNPLHPDAVTGAGDPGIFGFAGTTQRGVPSSVTSLRQYARTSSTFPPGHCSLNVLRAPERDAPGSRGCGGR